MPIRFAILAGVSTDPQAHESKASIPDQIDVCRAKIKSFGGLEATAPYILDGYSRTDYDSLEIAMADIPPLGDAIHAAEKDHYDVLIMENYDRLGDLGLLVGTRFRKLRKQLYSAHQSGPLVDPDKYDPYASEASDIDMYVEGIVQRYRINKIRRGWQIGIPQRARAGLHPLSVPYGYRVSGKDQPAEQVPEEVALIKEMVAMFLQGKTLQDIVDHANAVRPPRRARSWSRVVIKRILLNRFYAGITTFGRFKKVNKKRLPVPPSEWVSGTGKHVPIHSPEMYQALLAEAERRDGTRSRSKTYTLSGVLSCSVCGARMHRHGKLATQVDLCCPRGHIYIRYDVALKFVANTVTKELENYLRNPPAEDDTHPAQAQLAALEDERQLVQQGYLEKIFSREEAGKKILAIENEQAKLVTRLENSETRRLQRLALLEYAKGTDLSILRERIQHDDPTEVNHFLTALCETITITPRYELTVKWR